MRFSDKRYNKMPYLRCGNSGLKLPRVSLGFWNNFGATADRGVMRNIMRRAFDLGITSFDLANNYGAPAGSAEEQVGRILAEDFAGHRDELIIATKAGYRMWPGPYGDGGSRKYLLASLDQSLKRLGVDYVDIFYSHRFDPDTPLEETMGTLDQAVRQGKALYAGISNHNGEQTAQTCRIMNDLGTAVVINQVPYSLIRRSYDYDTFSQARDEGVGIMAFSPLAQGILTGKYCGGIPDRSRAADEAGTLRPEHISEDVLKKVERLVAIAEERGQSLAQFAISWVLRDERVTSVLIGASSPEQIDQNLKCLDNIRFSADELRRIDEIIDGGHRSQ